MPEGDTIFRTARSMRQWLEGREITAARSQRVRVAPERLVGQTVEAVEARGKHLLIRLSSGAVLHTHMKMTGSWHVYRAGERWRKPGWQARVVLEAGDRTAVCFNAPVVEMIDGEELERHPSISRLGPDVLVDPLALDEVVRRARSGSSHRSVGELLLDQKVVSGVGNIYRCEALFLAGVHPGIQVSAVDDAALRRLVTTASQLMRSNLAVARGFERRFAPPGGPRGPWVYGRGGRPCFRCGTAVTVVRMGEPPREVWWCPSCQPAPTELSPTGKG